MHRKAVYKWRAATWIIGLANVPKDLCGLLCLISIFLIIYFTMLPPRERLKVWAEFRYQTYLLTRMCSPQTWHVTHIFTWLRCKPWNGSLKTLLVSSCTLICICHHWQICCSQSTSHFPLSPVELLNISAVHCCWVPVCDWPVRVLS